MAKNQNRQLDLFHTPEEIDRMRLLNFKLTAHPSLTGYLYGDIHEKERKQMKKELKQLRDKIK